MAQPPGRIHLPKLRKQTHHKTRMSNAPPPQRGLTFEVFIEVSRQHLNEPLAIPDGNPTQMMLSLCRGFLSCMEHNEATRRFIIDELLPTIDNETVKGLFINLLNAFPPGYEHERDENVRTVF